MVSFEEKKAAWLLKLEVPDIIADSLAEGDSLACNGCCLTLVGREGNTVSFELLEETIRLTSFEGLSRGALVNLERPLAADARLGGHFVSGHVDVRSTVLDFEQRGKNYYLRVAVPAEFSKYVVYKGSIAIDGISLTIAEAHADSARGVAHSAHARSDEPRRLQGGEIRQSRIRHTRKYVEKIAAGSRENSPYQPQA